MKHTELAGPLMIQPLSDDERDSRRIVIETGPYERFAIALKKDMCESMARDLLEDADELEARVTTEQNNLKAAAQLGLAAEHQANGVKPS